MSRPLIIKDEAFRVPRDGRDGAKGKDGVSPPAKEAESIIPMGIWSRRTEYPRLALVFSENDSWIAREPNKGREPSERSEYWQLVAKSIQGPSGPQGGAGQRGRSSIALQNEMRQEIDEISERIDELEIDGVTSVSAVFADTASMGMPIRLEDDGNAHLAIGQPEDETAYVKWIGCDGLALEDVEADATGRYATDGIIELDDWSAVTGTVSLSLGSQYILSETEPGKLIIFDPQATYLIVQSIGTAVSTTQLDIEIQTASYRNKRTAEYDSECKSGVILYQSSAGHVDKAKADDLSTATAVGLTFGNPAAGNVSRYLMHGPVIDPTKDWTDSTGSPALVPGPYWLSDVDAGLMTNVEPTTPGSYRVRLGEATDANTFFILIEPPELIT